MSDENGCPDPDCTDPTCDGKDAVSIGIPLPMDVDDFIFHMAAASMFGPEYTSKRFDHPENEELRMSITPIVIGALAALRMLGYAIPEPNETVTPDMLPASQMVNRYEDVPGYDPTSHDDAPKPGWSTGE